MSAQLVHVTDSISIENEYIREYLDSSDYNVDDYSYTSPVLERPKKFGQYDKPFPVTFTWKKGLEIDHLGLEIIDEHINKVILIDTIKASDGKYDLYNLIPGRKYIYYMHSVSHDFVNFPPIFGNFYVNGRIRMIRATNLTNIRDIGGLKTEDGKSLVYGKVIRGSCLDDIKEKQMKIRFDEEGASVLRDYLKIGADIDLRAPKDFLMTPEMVEEDSASLRSPLGDDIEYHLYSIRDFGAITSKNMYGDAIRCVVDCLERGINVYIHCVGGADRTGALCFLLEAMADVCENDLARDYEMTSFSRAKSNHKRNSTGAYNYMPSVQYIKENFQGETFAQKVQDYLIKTQGVTQAEIESFKRIMTE